MRVMVAWAVVAIGMSGCPSSRSGDPIETGSPDALDVGTDALPDVDPSCHWDCFFDRRCIDGRVIEQVHAPVPCDRWEGRCPSFVAGECSEGCSDRVPPWDAPWTAYCAEGEERIAGDPCATDDDCEPPARVDGERVYLACDAGVCVRSEPSWPADAGGPCSVTFEAQSSDAGDAYGVVADPTCSSGWCRFVAYAEPACDLHGCAVRCEHDWECPGEQRCLERFDWSDGIDAGALGSVRVCGSSLADEGLSCHSSP